LSFTILVTPAIILLQHGCTNVSDEAVGPGVSTPNFALVGGSGSTAAYQSRLFPDMCVSVVVPYASAKLLETWSCHFGANQQFIWNGPSGTIVPTSSRGLCWDAKGGLGREGDPIQLWTCYGAVQQNWSATAAGEIRGINNKCIGLATAVRANGTKLTLQTCDGSMSQQWDNQGPMGLTITGAGTGSGKVTAPPVADLPGLLCQISAGTWSPEQCTKMYPNVDILLTATPDPGSTFTGWAGACSGTSATCTVNMTTAKTVKATFDGTSPPSFTLNLSGQGDGSGTVKSQTGLTPAIDCTITSGTAAAKGCTASYPMATTVTLTAAPLAGHTFTGWSTGCTGAGPCILVMSENRAPTAEFAGPLGPEARLGRWDAPVPSPIVLIHASMTPQGKWLVFDRLGGTRIWAPEGGGFTRISQPSWCVSPNCHLFCSGHTFLADGRLLLAGGHNDVLGDYNGVTQASIFDGTSWSSTGAMHYRRWYPTLVTLENGDVVAMSGTQAPGVWSDIPERYNGSTWTALTSAKLTELPLYPRAFVEPKGGRIFYAGEGGSQYLDPSGTGSWTTAGLGNGGNRVAMSRNYGAAVMLDSKVLYAGGGGSGGPLDPCPGSVPQRSAEVIDLSAGTPTWTATGSMAFARRQFNLTVLPDGTVLATGGTSSCGFSDETAAVFPDELYDPQSGTWSTLASAAVVRVYHSTAALMPDGRVFAGGSGEGGGATDQFTSQIFSPPYLFKGSRPAYNLPSSAMHYAQAFTVQTSAAGLIRKVTIIGLTATTHGDNMGGRLNTLNFQAAADGQSLQVTPPASGRIAPPGPYMLFILNDKGVPSIAQTILLSQ